MMARGPWSAGRSDRPAGGGAGPHQGAAPALAVTDALVARFGRVGGGTVDRAGLWRAQTPQAFRFRPHSGGHLAHPGGALDDVEVARDAGLDVAIVEGEEAI
jgi:2-C-methyl-D-erythritol 4-phosphate cytidylyltransferase/2-C-methyl-D-erythritol 2,4-cyclodiphosphate synthase